MQLAVFTLFEEVIAVELLVSPVLSLYVTGRGSSEYASQNLNIVSKSSA